MKWDFVCTYPPPEILIVFNVFTFISFSIAEHPRYSPSLKLLSRRVLMTAAVCTDEVLSGINPPSQWGLNPREQ